jgi:hypothetical protein
MIVKMTDGFTHKRQSWYNYIYKISGLDSFLKRSYVDICLKDY